MWARRPDSTTTETTQTTPNSGAVYTLWVDDNFHYQDESERYCGGKFATLEEAIAKATKIVTEYLEGAHEPGMTADKLYESYAAFGEDPWIEGHSPAAFSAWDYAKEQANAMAEANLSPISRGYRRRWRSEAEYYEHIDNLRTQTARHKRRKSQVGLFYGFGTEPVPGDGRDWMDWIDTIIMWCDWKPGDPTAKDLEQEAIRKADEALARIIESSRGGRST